MNSSQLINSLSGRYRFEFKQITFVFIAIIVLQIIFSFVNRSMLTRYLTDYQQKNQVEYANQVGHITGFYLNLINTDALQGKEPEIERHRVEIFSQLFSFLNESNNLTEFEFIVVQEGTAVTVSTPEAFAQFTIDKKITDYVIAQSNESVIQLYRSIPKDYFRTEKQFLFIEKDQFFNFIIPIEKEGIFKGYLFLKYQPNVSSIKKEIIASYTETTYIYLSIVLLGMLGLYYIATYTAVERDEAQEALVEEHQEHVKSQIVFEKESLFTKRIYHTHHKAEKIMGFIKEDLRKINKDNIDEIRYRVTKYSNFISRVIYDMKWYDPPINTIRNSIFNTNINEIITFIIEHIFNRLTSANKMFEFHLDLDKSIPPVPINEFVIWEILEPIIQNSIDHGGDSFINIEIITRLNAFDDFIDLIIRDDGKGISKDLLVPDEDGVKILFKENVSTKTIQGQNSGYGCYIAYTISTERCGWSLNADNLEPKGCQFTFKIPLR